MQNDMLKNNIVPWQEKGRWVKITCISDGTAWKIDHDKSDGIFPNSYIASGNYINLASTEIDTYKYKLMDVKAKLFSPPSSGGFNMGVQYFMVYASSVRQNIVLCPVSYYTGVAEVYVFVSMD